MSRCLNTRMSPIVIRTCRPEHNHVCQQGRRFGSKRRRHLCEGVPSEEWERGPIGAIRDSLYPGQGDSARYAHVHTYSCTWMYAQQQQHAGN